jgi:hypothetical protein
MLNISVKPVTKFACSLTVKLWSQGKGMVQQLLADTYPFSARFPKRGASLVLHGWFTIPFPSHRIFDVPESGDPTVFIAEHSQSGFRT